MLFIILVFFVAGLAFTVAAIILARHWKEILLLDPLTIKAEQERQQREVIIRRRFERVRADQILPFKRLGRELKRLLSETYHEVYERLQAFETFYKSAKHPFANVAPSSRERIKALLLEAKSFGRDLKWADAERRYLEIVSLDNRHAEAYRGLGLIYLKQKLYPQAKETLEFVVKLKKADDGTYAGLAEMAELEENFAQAEVLRLKAVEASPRQACRHAEVAQFYLAQHKPERAWASAKKACDREPGSVKYAELALEVALANNDIKESRQRYQRLRLLTEDQTRLQNWKQRLEELEVSKSEN